MLMLWSDYSIVNFRNTYIERYKIIDFPKCNINLYVAYSFINFIISRQISYLMSVLLLFSALFMDPELLKSLASLLTLLQV